MKVSVDFLSDKVPFVYLKGELGTAKVGLLLLPEVVWFDNESDTDLSWKRLL